MNRETKSNFPQFISDYFHSVIGTIENQNIDIGGLLRRPKQGSKNVPFRILYELTGAKDFGTQHWRKHLSMVH